MKKVTSAMFQTLMYFSATYDLSVLFRCRLVFHPNETLNKFLEPKSDNWYFDVAKSVYRPDIYKVAAEELIKEGLVKSADFPDFC